MNTLTIFDTVDDEACREFVERILDNQVIFVLNGEYGLAECPSTEYRNEIGEPVPVCCLWSDEQLADACRKEEWFNHQLEAVPLAIFLNEWLVDMGEDGLLFGIDFNDELIGIEVEPLVLLGDILQTAENRNIDLGLPEEEILKLSQYYWQQQRQSAGQNFLN